MWALLLDVSYSQEGLCKVLSIFIVAATPTRKIIDLRVLLANKYPQYLRISGLHENWKFPVSWVKLYLDSLCFMILRKKHHLGKNAFLLPGRKVHNKLNFTL